MDNTVHVALEGDGEQPLPAEIRSRFGVENSILLDVALGGMNPPASTLWLNLQEYASNRDWDTCEVTTDPLLDTTSRFLLAALIKHCGLAPSVCGRSRWVHLIIRTSCFALPNFIYIDIFFCKVS